MGPAAVAYTSEENFRMTRKHFMLALASAALISGGQALAQGHGGGPPAGAGPGAGTAGGLGAQMGNGGAAFGADIRPDARVNSQGPTNAADTAIQTPMKTAC